VTDDATDGGDEGDGDGSRSGSGSGSGSEDWNWNRNGNQNRNHGDGPADDSGAGGDDEAGESDEAGGIDLALVAAVAENGVIGRDGEMPWHYPADLGRFKRITVGHPVVMGRHTYESIRDRIGGPLPDRVNVVLSRGDPELPDGDDAPPAARASGIGQALRVAESAARELGVDTVYVIGGASVYDAFLPRADRLHLTEIHERYEGDTRFPDWDRDDWVETGRDDRGEFSFVTYERR